MNIASTKIPIKLGFKFEYVKKAVGQGKLAELRTYSIFSESELPSLTIIW
jgi:hypothetical protein